MEGPPCPIWARARSPAFPEKLRGKAIRQLGSSGRFMCQALSRKQNTRRKPTLRAGEAPASYCSSYNSTL